MTEVEKLLKSLVPKTINATRYKSTSNFLPIKVISAAKSPLQIKPEMNVYMSKLFFVAAEAAPNNESRSASITMAT